MEPPSMSVMLSEPPLIPPRCITRHTTVLILQLPGIRLDKENVFETLVGLTGTFGIRTGDGIS